MNDKARKPRRHILRSLLLLCLLFLIAAFGLSYAVGWVSFRHGDGVFAIEIRTGKASEDTDRAVKGAKDATAETGKVLQDAGKRLEELGVQREGKGAIAPTDKSAVPKDGIERGESPKSTESGEQDDANAKDVIDD